MSVEPRVSVTLEQVGATRDEIVERAVRELDVFYGGRERYEIVEVRAQPHAQEVGGAIVLWTADVFALQEPNR